jgi:hypothetical protein
MNTGPVPARKRVVVALGGNAAYPPTIKGTAEEQLVLMRQVCAHLVEIIRAGWQLVLTHGNGPVVGNILYRMARTADELPPMPMDVCVAHSQGGMGYMLQQSFANVLVDSGLDIVVSCVVTEVEVDGGDPAFSNPTKPVGKFFVFIDEAHTMQGAGSANSNSVDFANMLKPAITKGTLKVIASTTWEEFYESFEKDRALMRRFYRISIDEPSQDTTIRILKGLSTRLNDFHEVEITEEAITAAVETAGRYIHDRKNPDKSIDLLDAACAKQRVLMNKDAQITKELIFEAVTCKNAN